MNVDYVLNVYFLDLKLSFGFNIMFYCNVKIIKNMKTICDKVANKIIFKKIDTKFKYKLVSELLTFCLTKFFSNAIEF